MAVSETLTELGLEMMQQQLEVCLQKLIKIFGS
jgi:hypothetical protein